MARKQIFIGSAGEARKHAELIANALKAAGYMPVPWWKSFPAGTVTLDRLAVIAREEVDGAIFLMTSHDKVWYREKALDAPRDNVVLEYGLFLSMLGRERTMIITDDAKLPTDTSGVTYQPLLRNKDRLSEAIVSHFDKIFEHSDLPPHQVVVVADPVTVDHQIQHPLPNDWHQRDCYFGAEGAKAWLSVVKDDSYWPKDQEHALRLILLEIAKSIDVRTFVSFGPGDASIDEEIAVILRGKEPWLRYIPIDISDGLLQRTINVLGTKVHVPVGLLCDFEVGQAFITQQLKKFAPRPALFALIGNTLGNLDRNEHSFIQQIRAMMKKGDYLLLDVSLAGPKWTFRQDRRGRHETYGKGYRKFIATGVARRYGLSVEAIARNFTKCIEFKNTHRSDVPKTQTIEVLYRAGQNKLRLVYAIRRYNWDALCSWLKRSFAFEIVLQKNVFDDDILGDGVILLKAK